MSPFPSEPTRFTDLQCFLRLSFISALHIPKAQPNLLVSGGGDEELMVWDWMSGKRLAKLPFWPVVKHTLLVFPPKYVRRRRGGEDDDDNNAAVMDEDAAEKSRTTTPAPVDGILGESSTDTNGPTLVVQKIDSIDNTIIFSLVG